MNESLKPLVSIIIPVYNREQIIKETIDSALSQDFKNFEIIIVDNKSTDNTYRIIREYSLIHNNIRVFQNEENLGPVKNWYNCISHAEGKYIKILWSDDKIRNDFLSKTVPILENDSDIGFVFSRTIIFTNNSEYDKYIYSDKSGTFSTDDFIEAHLFNAKDVPVSPGNALFRSKDIRKNLIIDIDNPKNLDFTKFGAGNDLLLYLRACDDYKKFYYVDEPLTYFRVHNTSLTMSNRLEEYYLFSKVFFMKHTLRYQHLRDKYYSILLCTKSYKYMVDELEFKVDKLIWIRGKINNVKLLIIKAKNKLLTIRRVKNE